MTSSTAAIARPRRSVPAAITLFFVAPFVAEYLLGDVSLKLLSALIVMAPMYGGGALLIREHVRHKGRGWPTILCLGAAYALLEEGLVTQSLFNPDYLNLHLQFLQPAHVAWLGIGGWWTLLMLNLHAFWSIGVSIALVEALWPERTREPWLGKVGHDVVDVIFLLGLVANTIFGYRQNQFWGSRAQLGVAAIVCVLLVVIALATPAGMGKREGTVPSPWLTGIAALVLGSLLRLVPMQWGWGAVAAMLAVDAVFLLMVYALSRRKTWTLLHTLSLGAGGAVAYGLHAFLGRPFGGGLVLARIGNVIFLLIALVLIAIGARRTAAVLDARSRVA
ncbi:MAG TPA: hypothetical protein VN734_10915 [Acidobacteriaceae bacterium]|nr:hypothetical protein [Acidobacteriaceae bacterium]